MARRALDYLVGFNISPILWTKLPGSKSAGRVQSVALRLLTEREQEIEVFQPNEFWTLNVNFLTKDNLIINTNINQLDGKKIEKFSFKNKVEVNSGVELIKNKKYIGFCNLFGPPFLLIIPEGARARVRTRTRVLVLTLALAPQVKSSSNN